ncbi:MAG: LamG-like jellyroll fold domain-containing protein [Verrucomicrobiia bacterium]|jgi:outer membrane protein assembly factor BamB
MVWPRLLKRILIAITVAAPMAAGAQGPVREWTFHSPSGDQGAFVDSVGGVAAKPIGSIALGESPPHIQIDRSDTFLSIADKGESVALPGKAITLETWAAFDKATKYNTAIGYIQDNGDFEKGWLLGAHDGAFQFAIGTSRLTYLRSKTPMTVGEWRHVVGVYDGRTMRLFVDGRLDAESTARSGDIEYADSWLRIGGYKDDNETYAFHGRLHSVAMFDRAMTAEEIAARYRAKKGSFPPPADDFFKVTPCLQFVGTDAARVRWVTAAPQPSRLEYVLPDGGAQEVEEAELKTVHEVRIDGLPFKSKFTYRVGGAGESGAIWFPAVEVDTAFNYSVTDLAKDANPFPRDELSEFYAAAAEDILRGSGIKQGYCLDYGCGEGRLAFELARRSGLMVVGVCWDEAQAQRVRQRLSSAGVYGSRITILTATSDRIPYPDYCFNLVVSDRFARQGLLPEDPQKVLRHVRPVGGTLFLGHLNGERASVVQRDLKLWFESAGAGKEGTVGGNPAIGAWGLYKRPKLKGAGSWTHMYGDAGQTSNSHDELLSGTTGDTIEVQWFGLPGPDAMIDRLGRNQGPLSHNGRLFTQGDDRLIVQDSYNGAILWSLEIPGMRRTNVKVDTSNSCIDDQAFYLAMGDSCWKLDAATGERLAVFSTEGRADDEIERDWGFIASEGHLLFGSAVRKGASFSGFYGPDQWYDKPTGPGTEKVCSDFYFAIDKDSGDELWRYEKGAILNPTISLGEGRVYFLESRHPAVLKSARGRVGMKELYEELYLVALDQQSGSFLWEKKVNYGETPTAIYLSYARDTVVVQSSLPKDKTYNLFVYEAKDGVELWRNKYPWRRSDHGHHVQHPVIAGDKLIAQPEYFELRTGKKLGDTPDRRKCSTLTGAANLLHYRDFNDEVWDLTTGKTSEWRGLRSSCWLGIISADGLILASESGGGCSCNFPIQLSIGYRTKNDY